MLPKRVLLIDDDDDIREIPALAFEGAGDFDVATAAHGREGVDEALRHRPDVVPLDVMMPGLDGPSTLALLRSHEATREVPVIFLTAKVQATDKRTLLALGAHGIIAKPFDPMLLPDHVLEILS